MAHEAEVGPRLVVGDDEHDVGGTVAGALVAVAQQVGAASRSLELGAVLRLVDEVLELHRVGFEVVKELVRRRLLEVARVHVALAADALPLGDAPGVAHEVLGEEVGAPRWRCLAADERHEGRALIRAGHVDTGDIEDGGGDVDVEHHP